MSTHSEHDFMATHELLIDLAQRLTALADQLRDAAAFLAKSSEKQLDVSLKTVVVHTERLEAAERRLRGHKERREKSIKADAMRALNRKAKRKKDN